MAVAIDLYPLVDQHMLSTGFFLYGFFQRGGQKTVPEVGQFCGS